MTCSGRSIRRTLRAWIASGALAALGGCLGGGSDHDQATAKRVDGSMALELDLSHGAPETPGTSLVDADGGRSFADIVLGFQELEGTPGSVVLKLGTRGLSPHQSFELASMIDAWTSRGIKTVCHADSLEGSALVVFASCTRRWLSPGGDVTALGVNIQLVHFARLLQKLQLEAQFVQIGKFKGASDPFLRDSASPEFRASAEETLAGIQNAWSAALERRMPGKDLARNLSSGPHTADEAMAMGLVDALGFIEDARTDAKAVSGASKIVSKFGRFSRESGLEAHILSVLRSLSGSEHVDKPHVALLRTTGAITMSGGGGLFGGAKEFARTAWPERSRGWNQTTMCVRSCCDSIRLGALRLRPIFSGRS